MERDKLAGYYESSDEEVRLSSSKARLTEFLTTNQILGRYIQPGSTILDIGAAAGCYSFHYARLGHEVVARDYVAHHIEQMRANPLCTELDIDTGVADVRDLSEFEDAVFDTVLCLGPLYHIGEDDERCRCVSECLRVLRPGGVLAVAYICKFMVFAHVARQKREYLSDELREEILDNAVALRQNPSNIWFFDAPNELEDWMSSFGVTKLTNAGTDGIAILLSDFINSLSDEEYEQWLKYHFQTCEEPSILGYSNHGLYVCRKPTV